MLNFLCTFSKYGLHVYGVFSASPETPLNWTIKIELDY